MLKINKNKEVIESIIFRYLSATASKEGVGKVYTDHLDELKSLMDKGVGKYDVEDAQNYNLGGTLGPKEIDL